MSTDSPNPPRTRAEMRALREAQAAADAVPDAPAVPSPASEVPRSAEPEAPKQPEETPGPRRTAVPGPDRPEVPRSAEPEAPKQPEETPPAPGIRRDQAPERPGPGRRFALLLGAVLGVLALVGGVLGVISLTQGPRLSSVQVDEAQAIEVSGSRVILTANQPLAEISDEQVSVDPAVPFTVDAAGRSVGVRFTVPLDDETTYTVTVADATGSGGGPSTDLTTTFTTPASEVFLLSRDADEKGNDIVFRTDLTGEQAVPVFTADRIDDFRATSTNLVVATESEDGSSVVVMDRDGSDQHELTLPGDGFVTGVQVSDRGGLVGYTYSDQEITDTSGRASVLVTQPIDGSGEPSIIEVAGEEASIAEWQFVPDSAAVLFIDWEGALALEDLSSDAGTQALGNAMSIMGVYRGTYTAIIERTDGTIVEVNLADGSEADLPASDPDYGTATTITPFPGGTLRHIVARDESGLPTGQSVIRVDDDGAATPIIEVESTDSILQTCASPSGQYAAVVVAPDLANNPYDELLAPLPTTLHTHLIDMATGEELVTVTGFDISWCQFGPIY